MFLLRCHASSELPIDWRRPGLIYEHEWTGNTVTGICKKYGVSRKTYYKWKNRYDNNGIDGLHDLSRVPGTNKVQGRHRDRRNNPRFATKEIWL